MFENPPASDWITGKRRAFETEGGPDSALNAIYEDCVKPVAYTAVISWNTVANATNALSRIVTNRDIVGKIDDLNLRQEKFMSIPWWLQNVSTGLSLGFVYAAAGKGAASVLRSGIGAVGLEGSAARFAGSSAFAQIVGATAFEGLRDKRADETTLGNATSGALGFSLFEAGNILGRSFGTPGLIAMRLATGAVGASAQHATSRLIASGHLPDGKELWRDGVTGGAMNLVLPVFQTRLSLSEGYAHPKIASTGEAPSVVHSLARSIALSTDVPDARPKPVKSGGLELQTREVSSLDSLDLRATSLHSFDLGTLELKATGQFSRTQPAPQLIDQGKQVITLVVGAKENGPFASIDDFHERGQRVINPEMRVLAINGRPGTELLFDDAALKAPLDAAMSDGLLTPSQAASVVESFPNSSLVKRLFVLDFDHPHEPWLQQIAGPQAHVYGEAFPNGDVYLYKPTNSESTQVTADHEWSHLLKLKSIKQSELFDTIGSSEMIRLGTTGEPISSNSEAWSILGQRLLSTDQLSAKSYALANPIRSSLYGRALGESLNSLLPSERGTGYQQQIDLVNYIESQVRPQAVNNLMGLAPATPRLQHLLQYLSQGASKYESLKK